MELLSSKWFLLCLLIVHQVCSSPLKDKSDDDSKSAKDVSEKSDENDSKEKDGTDSKEDGTVSDGPKEDDSKSQDDGSESDPNTEETGESNSSESKKDDDSETNESNDGSKSDPETEEEGPSSEEDEKETKKDDDKSDESDDKDSGDESSGSKDKKLLVILLDGMRHDYTTEDKKLKNFKIIEEIGTRAEHVEPVFPSNSANNGYTIMTGLWPEKHGIINNEMYHESKHDVFSLTSPNMTHKHWWKGEPIWITAESQGVKSAVYWLGGCDVEIKSKRPTLCVPYIDPNDVDIDDVTKKLESIVVDFGNNRYDLAIVYYEGVDLKGHLYGPNARKTRKEVREVDQMLGKLMKKINDTNMGDKMNVVILSDHGMTEANKIIDLDEHLDFNDVDKLIGETTFTMILPEANKEKEVYQQLRQANVKGLNVYKRNSLPKRFHLSKSSRLLPIILTADEGYIIDAPTIEGKVYPDGDPETHMGHHGYDPDRVDDMNTIFYAFGPDFKRDFVSPPLSQVDFYQLFADLLDIKAKKNDGSKKRIEELRYESEEDESDDNTEEDEESHGLNASDDDKEDEDDDDNDSDAGRMAVSSIVLIISSIIMRFMF